jgi:hypothetical protein
VKNNSSREAASLLAVAGKIIVALQQSSCACAGVFVSGCRHLLADKAAQTVQSASLALSWLAAMAVDSVDLWQNVWQNNSILSSSLTQQHVVPGCCLHSIAPHVPYQCMLFTSLVSCRALLFCSQYHCTTTKPLHQRRALLFAAQLLESCKSVTLCTVFAIHVHVVHKLACPAMLCCYFCLQFLESYKSVTLESMATAFDVGLPFLDTEVGRTAI